MAEIQLTGLSTGIDTSAIVEQLMQVESQRLNNYERDLAEEEAISDAFDELEGLLEGLNDTLEDLSDAADLRSYNTSSSDSDILEAEASEQATEGSHTVEVNRLATAERWIHSTGIEYAEDYVGAGTFIYSYDHEESAIITSDDTTLEDLVGLINNDANNPGVTASLLHHNDAYHLVLSGQEAGSDYQISIDDSNTEVWESESAFLQGGENAEVSTRLVDLDEFSGTLVGDESITITGTLHDGTAVNQTFSITADTKLSQLIGEINDAFTHTATARLVNGEIVLTDHTSGTSEMTLSLSYDAGSGSTSFSIPTISQATEGGTVTASLAGFAQADFMETQSAQDAQVRVDGYPPAVSTTSEIQTLTHEAANNGTYTLTYAGQTTAAISYDATAADVQAALEALSSVEVGDITVSGDDLGIQGVMTFTFAEMLGDVSLLSIDPSGLAPPTPANYVMAEQTKGNDGSTGWITRSTNAIDDLIAGVTLELYDVGTVTVTLSRDAESLEEKLTAMVDAYNEVMTFIDENTGYNEEEETGNLLQTDSTVRDINNALHSALVRKALGFLSDTDTFLTLAQVGLELDEDGQLSLDTSVLDDAISEDYLGVLALIGADKTGSSDSNTIQFYGASSRYTAGGSYDVQVTISGGVITSAQIRSEDDSTYRDMTISDNIIAGNTDFDDNGNPMYDENALQLSVDLSHDGTFTASIQVKQGIAGIVEDVVERALKARNGSLTMAQENIQDKIDKLEEEIEDEEERLDRVEERLRRRYATLESTLTLLQSQMSALGLAYSS
jgi:flagellar hook-associated protein 2